jgi:hypothetical protein
MTMTITPVTQFLLRYFNDFILEEGNLSSELPWRFEIHLSEVAKNFEKIPSPILRPTSSIHVHISTLKYILLH